jgi:uncharacterized protein (DUF58 family)
MSKPLVPSFSSTKEAVGFSSAFFRWIWQFYTWRLTQAGRWFFWASVAFLAYSTTSLEYQSYIALGFVLAFWTIAFVAMLLFKPHFRIETDHSDRVCAGETLEVETVVTALTSPLHRDFHVLPHRLPGAVDSAPDEGRPLPPLVRGQRSRVPLGLRCRSRGIFKLPAFRVETDFPFGILRSYQTFEHGRRLQVYPHFSPLTQLEIPAGRRFQPGGVAMLSVIGDSVEFIGNREYRDGDNIRDIDWRATARLNRPVVREYREEYFLRVALILDTHVPQARSHSKVEARRAAFERAVSLSAAVGDFLARQEYVVDLFAAGPHLYHLMAGRGLAYLEQILDILCCVDEVPEEPFALIAPELMNNLSRISTVICVFLDWTETRRQFVRTLIDQGVGVKALVVSDAACTLDPALDGVRVITSADFASGIAEL